MPGLRSMTGLAGYASVAPVFFHIQDVAVASFTDFVASIRNRLGRDFLEGVTPKMAVETKALRDEDAPENKEESQPQEEESGHTKEMIDVFESNHGLLDRPNYSNVRSYSVQTYASYRAGVTHGGDAAHTRGCGSVDLPW